MEIGIEQRLTLLERQMRRWRLGAMLAVVAAGAFIWMGQAPNKPPALTCSSLTVQDAEGHQAIVLSTTKAGTAALLLSTPDDKSKAMLAASKNRAVVSLSVNDKVWTSVESTSAPEDLAPAEK